jgi:hypothetical protein
LVFSKNIIIFKNADFQKFPKKIVKENGKGIEVFRNILFFKMENSIFKKKL